MALREGDFIRFEEWPEGLVLLRFSSSAPEDVARAAAAVPDSDNARVAQLLANVAAQLPAKVAADSGLVAGADALTCLLRAVDEAKRVLDLDDLRADRGEMDVVDAEDFVIAAAPTTPCGPTRPSTTGRRGKRTSPARGPSNHRSDRPVGGIPYIHGL